MALLNVYSFWHTFVFVILNLGCLFAAKIFSVNEFTNKIIEILKESLLYFKNNFLKNTFFFHAK